MVISILTVLKDTIHLIKGNQYIFDQTNSNNTHPLALSTTSDGTHNSRSKYTSGWTI